MKKQGKHFTVFEHQTIKIGQEIDGQEVSKMLIEGLEKHYGAKGVPYYSLVHTGVRFNEHVGALQIADTIIEVLPKVDNAGLLPTDKKHWQSFLISMLLEVGVFNVHAPTASNLKLKANSILDLYFELFINEVEYLLHNGLIKKYRKTAGNLTALKGNLNFAKNIQKNLCHQELFFVSHSSYDFDHILHQILAKTIRLLKNINTNMALNSRIGALLLNFPEVKDIKITEATFEKLVFDRKSTPYKKAIDISKLLLLKYHPDLSKGQNNVLALMFDMNLLWEQFIYTSLRKHKGENTITTQNSKNFWKPESGIHSKIRPDIVLNKDKPNCIVLDTKWKNLNGYNPSPDDLRQMYVYHEYYKASKVALIYPGIQPSYKKGNFIKNQGVEMECGVISI